MLLMALAVGVLVLLVMGLLASCLVLKGAGIRIIELAIPVGLFLASLLGGVFACAKLKRAPLLWGVCVAAELSLVCILVGMLTYGGADMATIIQRCCVTLAGGVAAGVLAALTGK